METGWLIAAVDYSVYRLRVVSQPGPILQQVLVQNQGEVAYWFTTTQMVVVRLVESCH